MLRWNIYKYKSCIYIKNYKFLIPMYPTYKSGLWIILGGGLILGMVVVINVRRDRNGNWSVANNNNNNNKDAQQGHSVSRQVNPFEGRELVHGEMQEWHQRHEEVLRARFAPELALERQAAGENGGAEISVVNAK
jgi:hypothetical protein